MIVQPEFMAPTPDVTHDLHGESENQAEILAVTAPAKAKPPLVLVVEDEEAIGHLIVFMLKREGFKVEWKKNGNDADHFIHYNDAPTLVLLDINLPDIDGYGLLGLIRARISWQQTPVIMLTAMSQANDVAKAVASGADDYLLKPFLPAELIKRVHKLCSRQCSQPDPNLLQT